MWTLVLPCVRLDCRSRVLCMYGRYVVIMSLPASANFSDTVKTRIKDMSWDGFQADVVLIYWPTVTPQL